MLFGQWRKPHCPFFVLEFNLTVEVIISSIVQLQLIRADESGGQNNGVDICWDGHLIDHHGLFTRVVNEIERKACVHLTKIEGVIIDTGLWRLIFCLIVP